MRSPFLATAAAILPLWLSACSPIPGEEQTLVDRAALTVQEMVSQTLSDQPAVMLRR